MGALIGELDFIGMCMAEMIRATSAMFYERVTFMDNSMSQNNGESYIKYQRCIDCGYKKPAPDFPPIYAPPSRRIVGRQPRCKKCQSALNKKAYKERKQQERFDKKLEVPWEERVANRKEKYTRINLKVSYNITLEQYQDVLASQKGVCAICGSTDWRRLAVDHDHKTGILRGLLCSACNMGLGHFEDNIERLEQAISYLKIHQSWEFHKGEENEEEDDG